MKSTDGMETFSDSERVVERWSEHFQKLLSVPGDTDHEALDNIPQRITKTCLDENPTMDEMVRAIAGLKDGKAPGEVEFLLRANVILMVMLLQTWDQTRSKVSRVQRLKTIQVNCSFAIHVMHCNVSNASNNN